MGDRVCVAQFVLSTSKDDAVFLILVVFSLIGL